ncbi:hypothetical protein CEXT_128531 [Caerostris extrusa]|uniref:Uncharacterized protein n=1 Tax=Caerostris extrusa TaxID=172846 RepID=A0AAV4WE61_CAEEX|nr:hypothetical protein CEXT_128531 [Caerostris extrusa]
MKTPHRSTDTPTALRQRGVDPANYPPGRQTRHKSKAGPAFLGRQFSIRETTEEFFRIILGGLIYQANNNGMLPSRNSSNTPFINQTVSSTLFVHHQRLFEVTLPPGPFGAHRFRIIP